MDVHSWSEFLRKKEKEEERNIEEGWNGRGGNGGHLELRARVFFRLVKCHRAQKRNGTELAYVAYGHRTKSIDYRVLVREGRLAERNKIAHDR